MNAQFSEQSSEQFSEQSSEQTEMQEIVDRLVQAALKAVDPAAAVRQAVRREGALLTLEDRTYDLDAYERVYVVGGGKAGAPMAAALCEILGDRLTAGWVNVKEGHLSEQEMPACLTLHEAGHPIPNAAGQEGAQRILELANGAGPRDLLFCLISGGGSALMPLPVEGISLADLQALTAAMLRCGATINEINAVRKHCSQIKGGQLARAAAPATVVALLLSDVVGNPLDVIASGPTVGDRATFADAYGVLVKYGIADDVPPAIVARLRAGAAGEIPDTPKPGDPLFQGVQNVFVGSNAIAARAAARAAQEMGYHSLVLSTYVEGEAREVALVYAALAKSLVAEGWPIARPACVLAGGETTVTIRGDGKGGRNQEVALAAAIALEGWSGVTLATLATDGTDGPTDAAGAVVDGGTVARARALGLSAADYLARNDSYHFFDNLGDLVRTGPTNTNVNDLVFILAP
jgi:hydroxypyruvate reductase